MTRSATYGVDLSGEAGAPPAPAPGRAHAHAHAHAHAPPPKESGVASLAEDAGLPASALASPRAWARADPEAAMMQGLKRWVDEYVDVAARRKLLGSGAAAVR